MPIIVRQAFLSILAGAVLVGCGPEKTPDVNTAPVAVANADTGVINTNIIITLTGNDTDGDALTYHITRQPLHGTLTGTPPNLIYTPNTAYEGQDQFSFKVNDGELDSSSATVSLSIGATTPENQAPTADDLTINLTQDTSAAVTLTGGDADEDELTFRVMSQPIHGLLSGVAPNFTYTPDSGYVGEDSFSYVSHDGREDGLVARVLITVAPIVSVSKPVVTLNDSGITIGGNYPKGNNTRCIGETIDQQDCSNGRDATHNDDSDGHSGFSYTKLDVDGNELLSSATDWSCVRDNVTNLIWEVKTTDGGLHDANRSFLWYNSTGINDGGSTGTPSDNDCGGAGCDTEKFVTFVNSTGLCGARDWRMPSKTELINLVNFNRVNPAIDTDYFPATRSSSYASSSPKGSSGYAWGVHFYFGDTENRYTTGYAVRLVRVGQ